jgi:putative salt-induced outer membrane protein
MTFVASIAAALVSGGFAAAEPQEQGRGALPDGVRAMIEAAIASGDAKTIETVIRLARETHGLAGAEIDSIQQRWRLRVAEAEERQKQERQIQLAGADLFDEWKGQVELGASRSTGRSSYLGLYGSVAFNREGLRWRHKILGRAEVQNGRNVTDTERLIASWQPNYRFGDRLYAYGLGQFESDQAQGYDARYTAGAGIGYIVLAGPGAKLDVEGGPAFRHVEPDGRAAESSVATRASINLSWSIVPTIELKQTTALYLEEGDSSASALTSLDAQLLGPLKARFSYDVRYENSVRTGGESLDTLSRATLIYSF